MSETFTAPWLNRNHEQSGKYCKFQIKGWVNFDTTNKTLAEIAEGIEQGDGFLTLFEVVRTEDDLASIGDEEVRECFEKIIAARKLLQNVHDLPKKLIEELRSALKTEEGLGPERTVAAVASSSEIEESGSHVGRGHETRGLVEKRVAGAKSS